MGLLVDGVWTTDDDYFKGDKSGHFQRNRTSFRNWVTPDGEAGPTGDGGFKAEPGRYHLYVSYACPWAHRTLILRALKNLEDVISLSVVDYHLGENGWFFSERDGAIPDSVNGAEFLHQVYAKAKADYTGRVTVPVLWDRETDTIVSNESAEIIRMLDTAFDSFTDVRIDAYPEASRTEIDEINARIYRFVNNGVYRCGFAGTQEAYNDAFRSLFETLDGVEERLAQHRYLVGSPRPTEADWRLFTTLVRFDPVYYVHFKCNQRRIADYPNLSNYLRDLYQTPKVSETVNMHHIKQHYYGSHDVINPRLIVPLGPELDYGAPHDRERLN